MTARLASFLLSKDMDSKIASVLELAGAKASAVQVSAKAKDFLDLDMLITDEGITLPMALAAAQELYGVVFNPLITLKALSYFGDGDLHQLPDDVKMRLATAARDVDLDCLL